MITNTQHEPTRPLALARHYLSDLVYCANDGIITTFAVVSGVAGAALEPRIVVILGVANLLADGFSMGASNFLAIRSNQAALRADGDEPTEPFPVRHAVATFGAFVVAGAVPLLSYVTNLAPTAAFTTAVILTLVTLFLLGASRAFVTDGSWVKSGCEMLLVGSAAAAVAYGVGALIAGIVP